MSVRCLVTGATGFSGSYVVRELLDAGHEVVATDLPGALASPPWVAWDPEHPRLRLVASDLLDPATLPELFAAPIAWVFHTASLYDYAAPLKRLRSVNVEGTRNLLAAASAAPLKRFVHWSTCGVFGKPYTASYGARANLPFDEASPSPKNTPDDATEPPGTHLVNAYSVSKWEQEKLVWRAHRDDGLPLTVIRPAPIYGPGSGYGHGGIVLAIAHGLVPAIPADARNFVTTSVHVADVARFARFAVEHDACLGEDYNVVDDSIISYDAFLRYIALLSGRRMGRVPLVKMSHLRRLAVPAASALDWASRRLGMRRVRVFEVQSATYMSSSYWLSNRKTKAAGFEYRYPDVREGLKDTIAWMRAEGWFADRSHLWVQASAQGSKPA